MKASGIFKKKRTLLNWITGMVLTLLIVCAAFLFLFARMSMKNLLAQEIENRQAILKLNATNVNENLASLQGYLYQNFTDSEEITMIETGTEEDETEIFFVTQSLTRNLRKIAGWNASLCFLFFYSPDSLDDVFLQVSTRDSDYEERQELKAEVKDYIDGCLEENRSLGRGYLMVKTQTNGYVIRFYKIRNSYIGMCLDCQAVLEPLEELTSEGCQAFLADLDGNLISQTEGIPENFQIENHGKLLKIDGEEYLQLNELSEEGDFYIGTWTKASLVTGQLQWMENLIMIFLAGVLILVAVISLVIRKSLYQPILSMEQGMKRVKGGEWDLVVKTESRILEYDSMIYNFNDMVSEIKDLKIQNYEKELDAQKSYLQCLQLQINPHFYLNALNIIYSLAEVQDYELIQEMTMSLVEYSRYTFRRPEGLVTVSQEIEHVDNYMKIQRMRFPDRIDYQVNISSEIEDALIPPFVIQSFVENSIKHAVNFEQHNVLSVLGRLNEIEGELYVQLEIRDNGTGYSREVLEVMEETEPKDERYNVGIRNVRQRMQLIFGEKAKLILKNEDGAVTILLIPLTWKEEAEE
ncbi:MAG: histidine kinase [Eubacteriales bacterium]|nr:histidine kinase [Eubacteriales bacterium]